MDAMLIVAIATCFVMPIFVILIEIDRREFIKEMEEDLIEEMNEDG